MLRCNIQQIGTQNTICDLHKVLNTNTTVLNTLNTNAKHMIIQNIGRKGHKFEKTAFYSFHRYIGYAEMFMFTGKCRVVRKCLYLQPRRDADSVRSAGVASTET